MTVIPKSRLAVHASGPGVERARLLRQDMTDAERVLWRVLRNRAFSGHKFRRQTPIGRYVVDFLCEEAQLIVEVDGGQRAKQTSYDAERTRLLESHGYRVLRFWNNDVLTNIECVCATLTLALSQGRGN